MERKMTIKFIRKIDNLGRIVIPKDIREMFGFKPGDGIEISVNDMYILISKIEENKKWK